MMKSKSVTIWVMVVIGLIVSALAHADYIYVSCKDPYTSSADGTIEKFDSSGNRSIFASELRPAGLAFDSSGYLYAADNYNGTIDKFDSSGNRSIFASGLYRPSALAFDSSGFLYVTDFWTGDIHQFDQSGNGTIFASGLNYPQYIAVPQPATLLLLGLGALIVRRKR